jgi:hypothetical protein
MHATSQCRSNGSASRTSRKFDDTSRLHFHASVPAPCALYILFLTFRVPLGVLRSAIHLHSSAVTGLRFKQPGNSTAFHCYVHGPGTVSSTVNIVTHQVQLHPGVVQYAYHPRTMLVTAAQSRTQRNDFRKRTFLTMSIPPS